MAGAAAPVFSRRGIACGQTIWALSRRHLIEFGQIEADESSGLIKHSWFKKLCSAEYRPLIVCAFGGSRLSWAVWWRHGSYAGVE